MLLVASRLRSNTKKHIKKYNLGTFVTRTLHCLAILCLNDTQGTSLIRVIQHRFQSHWIENVTRQILISRGKCFLGSLKTVLFSGQHGHPTALKAECVIFGDFEDHQVDG